MSKDHLLAPYVRQFLLQDLIADLHHWISTTWKAAEWKTKNWWLIGWGFG